MTTQLRSAPATPAPVWDVINGFGTYWALRAALDLGLFDTLAEHDALSGPELAEALGAVGAEPATLLAQTLSAVELLAYDGSRFSLTPAAQRFLVSSSPASMAELVRYSPGPLSGWQQLADTVRTGHPDPAAAAELETFYPDLVRATAPTQSAVAAGVADRLRELGRWPANPSVADLGCGSGAWLAALLADGGTGVGVDRPGVLAVAERELGVAGLADRVTTVAGDYLDAALPIERADVVVLAHVLRAEPPERARRLLARAVALAAPSGVVVVADYPRPDAGAPGGAGALAAARHELLLSLTMVASTAGRGITTEELVAWAGTAGAELVTSFDPLPRQHVFLFAPTGKA